MCESCIRVMPVCIRTTYRYASITCCPVGGACITLTLARTLSIHNRNARTHTHILSLTLTLAINQSAFYLGQ